MNNTRKLRRNLLPVSFSQKSRLQSNYLRSLEEKPTEAGIFALQAHANVWLATVRYGRPVATDRRVG
jgi:hypothetical protein